ncbi:uncharacterized protein TM35_000016350 [Trypanosoma theileri]|uniref:Uncharacterized protein n=1 Tax=Trypanosoma theileri TaxID=67003 RepID=A0A1X0PA47_9TRYP|nr:uncharacterized protein TM35_000016350 [Trypanosoma theileri]ORC93758.1 hypothetical protein TM35_000016350 [Trypanosoma theileri]
MYVCRCELAAQTLPQWCGIPLSWGIGVCSALFALATPNGGVTFVRSSVCAAGAWVLSPCTWCVCTLAVRHSAVRVLRVNLVCRGRWRYLKRKLPRCVACMLVCLWV